MTYVERRGRVRITSIVQKRTNNALKLPLETTKLENKSKDLAEGERHKNKKHREVSEEKEKAIKKKKVVTETVETSKESERKKKEKGNIQSKKGNEKKKSKVLKVEEKRD